MNGEYVVVVARENSPEAYVFIRRGNALPILTYDIDKAIKYPINRGIKALPSIRRAELKRIGSLNGLCEKISVHLEKVRKKSP